MLLEVECMCDSRVHNLSDMKFDKFKCIFMSATEYELWFLGMIMVFCDSSFMSEYYDLFDLVQCKIGNNDSKLMFVCFISLSYLDCALHTGCLIAGFSA